MHNDSKKTYHCNEILICLGPRPTAHFTSFKFENKNNLQIPLCALLISAPCVVSNWKKGAIFSDIFSSCKQYSVKGSPDIKKLQKLEDALYEQMPTA